MTTPPSNQYERQLRNSKDTAEEEERRSRMYARMLDYIEQQVPGFTVGPMEAVTLAYICNKKIDVLPHDATAETVTQQVFGIEQGDTALDAMWKIQQVVHGCTMEGIDRLVQEAHGNDEERAKMETLRSMVAASHQDKEEKYKKGKMFSIGKIPAYWKPSWLKL
ncbi:MAG: hypothetical protein ABIG66_04255 [Candidatus Kerfeldbacteria bacterium]